MLTVTGPGPLWTVAEPSLAQPALRARPERVRGASRRAVARRYRRRRRPLPDLERAQPGRAGCSRSSPARAASARRSRRTSTAGSCAPPAPRSTTPTRAPRCVHRRARADAARTRARPQRAMRAADRSCARSAASTPATGRVRTGRCARLPAPAATASATTRTRVLRAPDQRNPHRDEAAFADLGRLCHGARPTSRRTAGSVHLRGGASRIHLTEFGYQTNPPDPLSGRPAAPQQAR